MHRTTISLEGPLERELRRLSAKEKRSFKELVNELIKKGLQVYRKAVRKKIDFDWNTAKAKPQRSFDPSNRATYFDLLSKKIP